MTNSTQSTANNKRMIGEVLLAGDFVSRNDLDRALAEQKITNDRLGEILVRTGVLSEMELQAVLAFQSD
ncbi:MAG: secretion system protein E, partial [Cyanobacteria bacterium NC_groundwater_1444_Ag_S-0.65um_54_12]|nr:secretion system protein E [Cyanobacteria bacterium NC_groundwater_1444_Ag_S-0.65um_54_12]